MEKQFTLRELETVHQFFMDGNIGQSNKEFILDQEVANKTEELIRKYQIKNFEKGTVVISSNFSANGGTFRIIRLSEVEERDAGIIDFDIESSVFKGLIGNEKGFMIEPYDYPHIEPYNRQQPYYFTSYDALDKKEFTKFNLYLQKKRDWDSRIHTRLDKFYYNDYWNTIRFDMLVSENDLKEFIGEFLALYNMIDMNEEILSYLA